MGERLPCTCGPGAPRCPACQAASPFSRSVLKQAAREAARKANAETQRLAAGPNLLAHCGKWHIITCLPLQVPCCGAVLLQEEPPHVP